MNVMGQDISVSQNALFCGAQTALSPEPLSSPVRRPAELLASPEPSPEAEVLRCAELTLLILISTALNARSCGLQGELGKHVEDRICRSPSVDREGLFQGKVKSGAQADSETALSSPPIRQRAELYLDAAQCEHDEGKRDTEAEGVREREGEACLHSPPVRQGADLRLGDDSDG